MRLLPAFVFGVIGFCMGVLLQAPVGGVAFTDWRGPVASLSMSGLGAGTGAGLGLPAGEPFRRGIMGTAAGAVAGVILGIAGSGILVSSIVATVLAISLARTG